MMYPLNGHINGLVCLTNVAQGTGKSEVFTVMVGSVAGPSVSMANVAGPVSTSSPYSISAGALLYVQDAVAAATATARAGGCSIYIGP